MSECAKCKIDYPDHILSPYMTNDPEVQVNGDVCGICALELSNKQHGINRTKFTGTTAEQFRQDAFAIRRKRGIE